MDGWIINGWMEVLNLKNELYVKSMLKTAMTGCVLINYVGNSEAVIFVPPNKDTA